MEQTMAGGVPARQRRHPSERVIEAVASAEGRDPAELQPPLFTAIDPDALDALLADADASGRCSVSFGYRGHEIVVRRNGAVRVDGR